MDKDSVIQRAVELPENYFRTRQPETIHISEYRAGQVIIARGVKNEYSVEDFLLASLSWYLDGDDCLFKELIFVRFTGKDVRCALEGTNIRFRIRDYSLLPTEESVHAERLKRFISDDESITFYEIDDTWNDFILLAETENDYYFYRWWTGE